MISEEEIKTIKKLQYLRDMGFLAYQGRFIKLFNAAVEFSESEIEMIPDAMTMKERIKEQLLKNVRLD